MAHFAIFGRCQGCAGREQPAADAPRRRPGRPVRTRGVAAHYGDPFREQRALAAGEASVDLSHRAVVRVGGPDRLSWLHSLTLPAPRPTCRRASATEALVLSPHGHVEHHLHLVDDGDAVWSHVEPGTAAALVAFLDSMRFCSAVEVADLSSTYAVVLRPTGGAPARRPRVVARTASSRSSRAPTSRPCSPGRSPGCGRYEALRVAAAGRGSGFETDHRTIPHEVGWIGTAVHLDKGCYRGQETVARVHNLGRPPRRLVLLHLDGSDSELPGARRRRSCSTTARSASSTSSARHHELGPIALALVKRRRPGRRDAASPAGSPPPRRSSSPPERARTVHDPLCAATPEPRACRCVAAQRILAYRAAVRPRGGG